MNSCGKAARRKYGTRQACKRRTRMAKHQKVFTDNKLTPAQYLAMKQEHRKAIARRTG